SFVLCVLVFFFSSRRRHTRFSRDWSSDVCSSDLLTSTSWEFVAQRRRGYVCGNAEHRPTEGRLRFPFIAPEESTMPRAIHQFLRSEERRVGKECRSRGWPDH